MTMRLMVQISAAAAALMMMVAAILLGVEAADCGRTHAAARRGRPHTMVPMARSAEIFRPLRLRGGYTEESLSEEQALEELREAGVDVNGLAEEEQQDGCGGCGDNDDGDGQDMEDYVPQAPPEGHKKSVLSATPAELKGLDAQLYDHLEKR
jgi:hypothetical protein